MAVESREARDRILQWAKQLKQPGGEYTKIYIKKDVHPSIMAEWKRLREAEKKEKALPESAGCEVSLDTREEVVQGRRDHR